MTMPRKHDRTAPSTRHTISDLVLEQYNLHELSAAQERMVRGELERDEILRGRLAAIQESDTEIRSAFPAERVVPQIRERLLREGAGAPNRTRRVPTTAWAVPAAAMVLFLVLVPLVTRQGGDTRLKGIAPHLLVFRKTTAGAEELRPGAVVRKGDVLQLSYAAGDARYGVIFSVDGRGTLTWHVPARYAGGAYAAPPLDPRGPVVLPSAYELDDAPGFERFFLVYSTKPFDVSEVNPLAHALTQRAAGDGAVLSLPRGLGQFTLLLKKQG
jgi:hypothetical protein